MGKITRWGGFALLLGAIFLLRRWDQFISPEVYAEDGMIVLPDALTVGWGALLDPVQGYIALTTRLFGSLALLPEGLAGYPFWGSILATLFAIFILIYIAATPSLLPRPFWFALAAALVPTGPEVFCLPFMGFWWAGLALMILVLRSDHRRRGLLISDLSLAVFCGLSGVIAPVAAAVLAVRLFYFRDRFFGGMWLFAVLTTTGCLQFLVFLLKGEGTAGENSPAAVVGGYLAEPAQSISRLIRRFFGEFLFPEVPGGVLPQSLLALAGVLLIGFLAVSGWRTGKPLFLYLWMFLAGTLALAIVRADFNLMHPLEAAPRYFFYPWILLSWMLIAVLILSKGIVIRTTCAACLILASAGLFRSLEGLPDDDLHWEQAVEKLHTDGFVLLPIHYNGRAEMKWELPIHYRDGEYRLHPISPKGPDRQ